VTGGRLLVTGATGFVGRHVLAALRGHAPRAPLRLLVHREAPAPDVASTSDIVYGDLADPRSLHGLCGGVDTVLHLACYVGDDEARCEVVNARGTEALVAVAQAAGVRRILYLSNAAVYGYAVRRQASEAEVDVAPATPISRSRARAERAVLAAGGIVLRPLFIYGDGDTRFLPALIRALGRLPFLINGGRARLSLIAAEDLGRVIAALARLAWTEADAGPYHVNDTHAVTLQEIVETLRRYFEVPRPWFPLPYALARWLLHLAADPSPSARHRAFLVAYDHSYDASRLWRRLPLSPGEPFVAQLERCVPWYARFARRRDATHAAVG